MLEVVGLYDKPSLTNLGIKLSSVFPPKAVATLLEAW
jgi:hypothetical protein